MSQASTSHAAAGSLQMCRPQAIGWPEANSRIQQQWILPPQPVVGLIRPHRHAHAGYTAIEQGDGPLQQCRVIDEDRGLVMAHALAAPARQHESAQKWRFAGSLHGTQDCPAAPGALKSLLPPVLVISRTSAITMSCDSALHMS